jgi:CelD/BcsL family acetyltransferase involved in cellulose biosynthesis
VRSITALPALRASQDPLLSLFAACDRTHVGTSFPFMLGAASAAAEEQRPWRLLLASRGTEITGCLFGRTMSPDVAGLRLATFELATHFGSDPLIAPGEGNGVLRDLLAGLVDEQRDAAMFVFPRLSERGFEQVTAVAADLGLPMQWRWAGFGYAFDTSMGLDAFLARMDGHRRREIERRRRRLIRDHAVEFCREEGLSREDNLQRLDAFLGLEDSGWKGRGGTSILRRPGQETFYHELVESAWRAGMLAWYVLRCEGRPIAMTLTLRSGPVRWLPKSAYDEQFANYAPGMLLAHHLLLEAAHDPSVRWVDNISGTPWVKAWNPMQVPVRTVTLFGRHASARLLRRMKDMKAFARGVASRKAGSVGPFDRPLR